MGFQRLRRRLEDLIRLPAEDLLQRREKELLPGVRLSSGLLHVLPGNRIGLPTAVGAGEVVGRRAAREPPFPRPGPRARGRLLQVPLEE